MCPDFQHPPSLWRFMAQGKVGSDTRVCGFLCFYEQLTETENKRLTSPQGEQSTVSIWHVISSSIMATAPPPPPALPTCLCFLPKKGKYHFDSQLTGQNLSRCSQCLILTLTSACPCVCLFQVRDRSSVSTVPTVLRRKATWKPMSRLYIGSPLTMPSTLTGGSTIPHLLTTHTLPVLDHPTEQPLPEKGNPQLHGLKRRTCPSKDLLSPRR